jgi:N6-L-threonylcarbamoyladenine synthase
MITYFCFMRILGFETSCDETSVAIVEAKNDREFVVEKSLVASQAAKHAEYGGVVPEVAAREHVSVIFPLLEAAGVPRDGQGIDVIAVTAGPGLVPALRIGVEVAKTLSWIWKKPLVAVNHMEGHVGSVFLNYNSTTFPSLCLLVSGGHTELLLMKNFCEFELLGRTRDDAAGEAFDKVAKLLGLPYPGGPEISKLALEGNRDAVDFPRPMMTDRKDLDFSFSGLKTAVSVYLKEIVFNHSTTPAVAHLPPSPSFGGRSRRASVDAAGLWRAQSSLNNSTTPNICASFEQAVVDVLVEKTRRAVEQFNPKSIIVSGGVSANRLLREQMTERLAPLPVFFPPLEFSGDNAAMIAVAGAWRAARKDFADPLNLEADPNMRLA